MNFGWNSTGCPDSHSHTGIGLSNGVNAFHLQGNSLFTASYYVLRASLQCLQDNLRTGDRVSALERGEPETDSGLRLYCTDSKAKLQDVEWLSRRTQTPYNGKLLLNVSFVLFAILGLDSLLSCEAGFNMEKVSAANYQKKMGSGTWRGPWGGFQRFSANSRVV